LLATLSNYGRGEPCLQAVVLEVQARQGKRTQEPQQDSDVDDDDAYADGGK